MTYGDDAEGNILVRSDPGMTTLYLPGEELTRTTSTGVITGTRYYIHAGVTVAVRVGFANDDMLFADPAGTTDVSVPTTISGTGTPVRRHLDPYGTVLTAGTGTWPDAHGFLNKPADPTTGLSDLGAREYNPALGRFTSVDPLLNGADPQSTNGYAYADNNPVTEEDPTGKDAYSQETPCGDIDCGVSNGDQAPTASPLNTTQNNPGHDWTDRNGNANPVECRASSTGAPTYFTAKAHLPHSKPAPPEFHQRGTGTCGRACSEVQADWSLGQACNDDPSPGGCVMPALAGAFFIGGGAIVCAAGGCELAAVCVSDAVACGYAANAASVGLGGAGATTAYTGVRVLSQAEADPGDEEFTATTWQEAWTQASAGDLASSAQQTIASVRRIHMVVPLILSSQGW